MCRANNDMYNSALYVLRNVLTALDKKPEDRHEKEQEVLDSITAALPKMNATKRARKKDYALPGEDDWHQLSYGFLDAYFKVTRHPAYYADGFPAQSAQQSIRQACEDMDSFWKGIVAWQQQPELFTGKPSLPHYKHKGGISAATITNQDAEVIRLRDRGRQAYELKLPKLDLMKEGDGSERAKRPSCMGSSSNRLRLGEYRPVGRLQQVEVVPCHGEYSLNLIFDDGVDEEERAERVKAIVPSRIAWIDPGVNRIVAAVTNCGGECLIISGGPIKSVNQWYNKEFARIQSEETKGGVISEDGEKAGRRFMMTGEAEALLRYRDAYVSDFLHKVVSRVLAWCVENRIDTLGMNYNSDWKDDCKMRHEAKQLFMQLPFARFRDLLSLACAKAGIKFLTVEESFTSKASFLDGDYIPSYGGDDAKGWRSSGRRTRRGLFRSADGTVIHADLNGAANGLRKMFPDAFEREGTVVPDFGRVRFLGHPDEAFSVVNRRNQVALSRLHPVSKSKARRDVRRLRHWVDAGVCVLNVVPHGIGLCE